MKNSKSISEELESISWKDINKLIKNGQFKSTKRPLSRETYIFMAKDKNYETVIQLIFTSLQKTDPEHANLEYAIQIAEEVQKLAKTIVKKMDQEE